MIDVLLVNPPNPTDRYASGQDMPPDGMLLVAAVLEQAGYDVGVLDLEFGDQDVTATIEQERPHVVGIAGTSVARFSAFEIARTAKKTDPNLLVVYGGTHASFTAQDTLDHVPEIDVIVRGEGEISLLELVVAAKANADDFSKILGISYRENGGVIHNGNRPRIKDLDTLPLPARHLVDMGRYRLQLDLINKPAMSLLTSRGCPFKCSFCSASAMFGNPVAYRSAKSVVDEMEHLLEKYGIWGFKVFDSTFTLSRSHAESVCEELIRRGINVLWECEIRVDTVNPSLLEKLKAAGCYLIDYGIESASQQMLRRMKKAITLEQVENVIKWANQIGLRQKAFFTIGHIGETPEDAMCTVEFIRAHLTDITQMGTSVGIRIYPGTELEQFAFDQGLLSDFSWSEPFEDARNTMLNAPTTIPLLIQPGLGHEELLAINRRILSQKARSPLFMLRKVFHSHSKADMRRYLKNLRKLIRL